MQNTTGAHRCCPGRTRRPESGSCWMRAAMQRMSSWPSAAASSCHSLQKPCCISTTICLMMLVKLGGSLLWMNTKEAAIPRKKSVLSARWIAGISVMKSATVCGISWRRGKRTVRFCASTITARRNFCEVSRSWISRIAPIKPECGSSRRCGTLSPRTISPVRFGAVVMSQAAKVVSTAFGRNRIQRKRRQISSKRNTELAAAMLPSHTTFILTRIIAEKA